MDAKNSHFQPMAYSSSANGHQDVLPILAKPGDWDHTAIYNYNTLPTSSLAPTTTLTTPTLSSTSPPANDEAAVPRSVPNPSPRQDVGKNAVSKNRKPRKPSAAPTGRSTLFWVHTDPKSVSEGTREETLKRIRSHVMSEHNRKKRLENTKRYKSKTWKHLAFQPVETTASNSSTTPETPTTPPQRSPVTPPSLRNRESLSPSSSPEQQQHEEQSQYEFVVTESSGFPTPTGSVESYSSSVTSQNHVVSSVQAVSPLVYLSHGATDPFDSMHTPISDRMHRHLQHFFHLTQMAYPLQRRYGPKLKAHWSSFVQRDPVTLHASICVAASNSALETGEFPLVDPSRARTSVLVIDTFHHRGETIRLVNEGLSDPSKAASDVLIAAVSILLTIEIASGNPDFLKIHLAGLRQMVAMRNSFADVPSDVRFQISWTDVRVACMAFTKPIFPFVRYARPSQFTLIPPHRDLANTASSLIALIEIPGIFGDAMSKTIYDLIELTWYAEWIKGDPNWQDFDDETEDYFNTEVLYVEYSLHSDRYMASGEPKSDATIEGCVRLACLLFHNTAIWEFYPQIAPVFPKPIIVLRIALEHTIPAGYFTLCRELLIWILFMGASSAGTLARERTFFVTELAIVMRGQGIQSWHELRAMLLGYFYVDRCYLASLRGLWDEVQMLQSSPVG